MSSQMVFLLHKGKCHDFIISQSILIYFFQLVKEYAFNNVDALEPSKEMLEKAKDKGVYNRCFECSTGRGIVLPINKSKKFLHDIINQFYFNN